MEYLVRFAQVHESFRKPEIQALADLFAFDLEFLEYSQYVCYFLMNIHSSMQNFEFTIVNQHAFFGLLTVFLVPSLHCSPVE